MGCSVSSDKAKVLPVVPDVSSEVEVEKLDPDGQDLIWKRARETGHGSCEAPTDVDVLVETREARYARSCAAPSQFTSSTKFVK